MGGGGGPSGMMQRLGGINLVSGFGAGITGQTTDTVITHWIQLKTSLLRTKVKIIPGISGRIGEKLSPAQLVKKLGQSTLLLH